MTPDYLRFRLQRLVEDLTMLRRSTARGADLAVIGDIVARTYAIVKQDLEAYAAESMPVHICPTDPQQCDAHCHRTYQISADEISRRKKK